MVDVRFPVFHQRGCNSFFLDETHHHPAVFCNIDSWLSHLCALAISIGKTLSVSTRFTAICFAHRRDVNPRKSLDIENIDFQLWEGRMVKICLCAMWGIPFALYAYLPFLPASFGPTPNGYGVYLGITNPGFLVCSFQFVSDL